MYTYQMKLDGEVLRVGFNRTLPAQGDRIVKDTLELLTQMINAGEISGGNRILIDGAQSVAVAYVIAHKLAHLYNVVAVLDPKLGSKTSTATGTLRRKSYIVAISHCPSSKVGDVIETEEQQPERNIIKVVLCGPPHSGKSCLREGLKQAILGTLNAPYPYVITACPDGEGSWYQKTYECNQKLAIDGKPCLKSELTLEFAQQAAQWVKSANQLINIIDVGGQTSPENKIIMEHASHAIILAGDTDKFGEWEEFCQKLKLKIVAKIHSQLNATEDEVFCPENWRLNTNELLQTAPLLMGRVHRLERGEDVSTRPMIQAVASVLIHLTKC